MTIQQLSRKNNALILFAKQARKGKVKTRIAKEAGEAKALEIYRTLLEHIKQLLPSVDARIYIFADQHPVFDIVPDETKEYLQTGSNLGAKMYAAFQKVFEEKISKVIIIGSDCPYITPELINEAFDALEETDICIGPATDGGYYLLGMNSLHPELFKHIKWSSDKVLSQTIAKATDLGLSIQLLDKLEDIDTFEAWNKYQQQNNVKKEK